MDQKYSETFVTENENEAAHSVADSKNINDEQDATNMEFPAVNTTQHSSRFSFHPKLTADDFNDLLTLNQRGGTNQ